LRVSNCLSSFVGLNGFLLSATINADLYWRVSVAGASTHDFG